MSSPACGSCEAPTGDGAKLCSGCTRDLAGLLLLAASIAPDLDDAVARLLRRGSGGRRSETEAPLPVDLAASDAKHNLRASLLWCIAGVNPGGYVLALDIPEAARLLATRLADVRRHPSAAHMLYKVRLRVHGALAVIDRKPERAPAGMCDNCGRQLLAELGAESVTCACGMTVINLQADRMNRAAKADQLNSATAIAGALTMMGTPVLASTVRTWATRGRLVKRGERDGDPVYSIADVIELCNQRDDRKRRPRVRS